MNISLGKKPHKYLLQSFVASFFEYTSSFAPYLFIILVLTYWIASRLAILGPLTHTTNHHISALRRLKLYLQNKTPTAPNLWCAPSFISHILSSFPQLNGGLPCSLLSLTRPLVSFSLLTWLSNFLLWCLLLLNNTVHLIVCGLSSPVDFIFFRDRLLSLKLKPNILDVDEKLEMIKKTIWNLNYSQYI